MINIVLDIRLLGVGLIIVITIFLCFIFSILSLNALVHLPYYLRVLKMDFLFSEYEDERPAKSKSTIVTVININIMSVQWAQFYPWME